MLRAILNKSWRQHPTRHQLYGHLPPITKTIQVRRTRHAGTLLEKQRWTHKRCTLMDPPHTAAQKQDDQHERTFSSYVRDTGLFVLKTYLGRWTIGRSGERGVRDIRAASTIMMMMMIYIVIHRQICFVSIRSHQCNNIYIYIYIYIYITY